MVCRAIGLDSVNAAIQYNNGNALGGIAWTVCAILWAIAIILRVTNPE